MGGPAGTDNCDMDGGVGQHPATASYPTVALRLLANRASTLTTSRLRWKAEPVKVGAARPGWNRVIAHGLPSSANLHVIQSLEKAVRAAGATPATVGLIEGRMRVGLETRPARTQLPRHHR